MKPLLKLGTLRKSKRILESIIGSFLLDNFNIALSYSEYLLLFHIYHNEGITQYSLSKKLHVSSPMINKMISNLNYYDLISVNYKERQGLRKSYLELSPTGLKIVLSSKKFIQDTLTQSELESLFQLEEGLRKLNSLL